MDIPKEEKLPKIYAKGTDYLHGKVVENVRMAKGRVVITFAGEPLTFLELQADGLEVGFGELETVNVYRLKPEIQRALNATTAAGRARGRKLYGIVYNGDPRPTGEHITEITEDQAAKMAGEHFARKAAAAGRAHKK